MNRWLWAALGLVSATLVGYFLGFPLLNRVKPTIKVGLIHSMTGSTAVNEKSMVDAEILAIEEINAAGGLLGRRLEYEIADGRSQPETFARETERLIKDKHVSVLVGGYSSAGRKAMIPILERSTHLLIFPVAYEGLEKSPNVVYTGAAPNQQIIPSVNWCREKFNGEKYVLIGNDFLWSRAVNTIIRDQLKSLNAKVSGEFYVPMGSTDLADAVEKVIAAKPDVILSTLAGDSNLPFYELIRGGKIDAARIPIVSFIVAEDELRALPARSMVNDYSVGNYFQAIDRPENVAFVKRFRDRFGADRATSDSIVTAYNSIYFWAQAVREAETDEVNEVRSVLLRQSLNAPEGVISIDRESQHTWRPFFVGKIKPDGQIDIIESLTKAIKPSPYPFSKTHGEWESYLRELSAQWNGAWVAPAGMKPADNPR